MAEPFLGEIRVASFGMIPRGWAPCNGQLLSIQQNSALFSLLGTTYGGDGRTTFALPDLQGRVPLHVAPTIPQGSAAGEAAHALVDTELPAHSHSLMAVSDTANTAQPGNAMPAAKGRGGRDIYAPSGSAPTPLTAQTLALAGSGQGHNNVQPSLTLNFIIALQGIFPSRS